MLDCSCVSFFLSRRDYLDCGDPTVDSSNKGDPENILRWPYEGRSYIDSWVGSWSNLLDQPIRLVVELSRFSYGEMRYEI
ncbi:hypothetical protein TIFTF001_046575 [Ficus carica]|uniref:Uncharacterized protein n=1 Tax=Ficus carica TaxID=3494 RepID=A0AA88CW49_FICCA|nr:hypothetical protein TIFTF001_046575 [Ficus carica]